MSGRISHCLLLLALLLALLHGGAAAQTPTGGDAEVNVIIAVQGQASVKRSGWNAYAPALFGTTLRRGDLLRLESRAQVKVICAGLTAYDAPNGISGVSCPTARPVLHYRGSAVLSTRGYHAASFPLIIAPRKTRLLDPQPRLRWTAVAGAPAYEVTVRGPQLNWTTEIRGRAETSYPSIAPPLKPGSDYKLIVKAGARQSDEEGTPGLGFTVLAEKEAKEVRREEQRIRDLRLADAPTRFLVVHLYAAYGLHAEAIEQLEELTKTLREPAPLRLLGDLYQTVGLSRQAEQQYELALELSRKAGDEEGQALAHKALAAIYEAHGKKNLAVQQLKAVRELAQKLGDRPTLEWSDARLAKLK